MILLVTTAYFILHAVSAKYFRIINGEVDSRNEFSFVVSLERQRTLHPDFKVFRLCSGSLISAAWVLTAAHCCVAALAIVRYGDMTVPRNETKSLSPVLKMIRHPDFKVNPFVFNDIGLVKIEELQIGIGKMSAVDYKTLSGYAVKYAGFGLTQVTGKMILNQLKIADEDSSKPLQVSKGMICACPEEHSSNRYPVICTRSRCSERHHGGNYGDSGGPLFHDGRIVAVISAGIPNSLTMSTPVSPFLDWIWIAAGWNMCSCAHSLYGMTWCHRLPPLNGDHERELTADIVKAIPDPEVTLTHQATRIHF